MELFEEKLFAVAALNAVVALNLVILFYVVGYKHELYAQEVALMTVTLWKQY